MKGREQGVVYDEGLIEFSDKGNGGGVRTSTDARGLRVHMAAQAHKTLGVMLMEMMQQFPPQSEQVVEV